MNQQLSGREMADVAVEYGAIDMAQGVVHIPPPKIFLELLVEKFQERRVHVYASPAGYIEYRKTILNRLRQERPGLKLESVMAINGTTGGLVSALRSFCQPFDKVVLLEPFYPAHDWVIQSLSLVTDYVPYKDDFNLDFEAVREALRGAKALVIGNPANPTGTVLGSQELLSIYELCRQEGVLMIVDEVYKDFVWRGKFESLLSAVEDLDNLVVLRSFSKNFALAGWRVGYAIAAPELRSSMTHIHDALYVGAPSVPQYVMTDILQDHKDIMRLFKVKIIKLYRENREAVIKAFRAYGMEPVPQQGAYYMMVKHNRCSDMAAVQELLAKKIAVAPGAPFWRPGTKDTGYIRVHFAISEKDRQRLEQVLIAERVLA